MDTLRRVGLLIGLLAAVNPMMAQAVTRDPNTPGFVTAKELADGSAPPSDANGNFVIGPTVGFKSYASIQRKRLHISIARYKLGVDAYKEIEPLLEILSPSPKLDKLLLHRR